MIFPFKPDSLAKQISVKSAVNPSLLASVFISIPLLYFADKSYGLLKIIYVCGALLPIVAFIFSYLYFLFKNPDYLRSEEYQLKIESLRLLGDKDNPLNADASDVVSMNNPKLPPPSKKEKDE